MTTLTPFGRQLRMMRLDRSETMKDMTEQLAKVTGYEITPAFLSAVELGRKPVSTELVDAVITTYRLPPDVQQRLRETAEESASIVKIRPTQETRTLVTQFARRFKQLDPQEIDQILKVLHASDGAKKR